MNPVIKQVEDLQGSFVCKRKPWYEHIVDAVGPSAGDEDSLLEVVHEEMSKFYDLVNEREMAGVRKKYPNARIVMYKIAEKVQEMDK